MSLDEIRALSRDELFARAAEHVGAQRPDFDPRLFNCMTVEDNGDCVNVDLETPFEFRPLDRSEDLGAFRVTVSFGAQRVNTFIPAKLYVPSETYLKIAALMEAGKVPGGDHTRVRQTPGGYEMTVSHGAGEGAEGYSLDLERGEAEMIWHEHPEPDAMPEEFEG